VPSWLVGYDDEQGFVQAGPLHALARGPQSF